MKKAISALILSLLFVMVLTVAAPPCGAVSPVTLSLSAAARNEGGRVVYDVTLSSNVPLAGAQGLLVYDHNLLSLQNVTAAPALIAKNGAESFKSLDEGLRWILIGDTAAGNTGNWFTVTFTVKGDSQGTAAFALNSIKASLVGGTPAETEANGCEIAVNGFHMGDVNDDGGVDIRDLIRLKKYFAGTVGANMIRPDKADMDGSGVVDAPDLTLLRKKLLNLV